MENNYTMNNSASMEEMDICSAPPSIPVGVSPDKASDQSKSNLLVLKKVDDVRPSIITPSDWGAPDQSVSQRTGQNVHRESHQMS